MALTTLVAQTVGGLSTANSYVTVSELEQYAEDIGYTFSGDETDDTKTSAIYRALQYIELEEKYFFGRRSFTEQSTAFPRTGFYLNATKNRFIPAGVKKTQLAFAIYELDEARNGIPSVSPDARVLETEDRVGPVVSKVKYERGTTQRTAQSKYFTQADMYLRSLILGSTGNIPLNVDVIQR